MAAVTLDIHENGQLQFLRVPTGSMCAAGQNENTYVVNSHDCKAEVTEDRARQFDEMCKGRLTALRGNKLSKTPVGRLKVLKSIHCLHLVCFPPLGGTMIAPHSEVDKRAWRDYWLSGGR